MKQLFTPLLLAAALTASGIAAAQTTDPHAGHQMPATAKASATAADGEIRKLDLATGKVTIKHGPIKSIDMPPMTMTYQLRDKAMLGKLKVGDKVRFAVEATKGDYLVTDIQPAK